MSLKLVSCSLFSAYPLCSLFPFFLLFLSPLDYFFFILSPLLAYYKSFLVILYGLWYMLLISALLRFQFSHVRLFATPWITACQASLSITNSQSSLKLMSIKPVMPSGHLILCRPLLLLPPVPPSIRVFSNESTLHMKWPKYWSFSFNISPSMNTQDWAPLGWTGWISL